MMYADPPHFVVRPRAYYQRQPGQSVVMPCVAGGEPHPTISWKKVRHNNVYRLRVIVTSWDLAEEPSWRF